MQMDKHDFCSETAVQYGASKGLKLKYDLLTMMMMMTTTTTTKTCTKIRAHSNNFEPDYQAEWQL
jgi:hypothetical protein